VELLEDVAQIAKPVDADELRPFMVDVLKALDVAERFELVHEAHDRLLC
jgi:hypothetical protein